MSNYIYVVSEHYKNQSLGFSEHCILALLPSNINPIEYVHEKYKVDAALVGVEDGIWLDKKFYAVRWHTENFDVENYQHCIALLANDKQIDEYKLKKLTDNRVFQFEKDEITSNENEGNYFYLRSQNDNAKMLSIQKVYLKSIHVRNNNITTL